MSSGLSLIVALSVLVGHAPSLPTFALKIHVGRNHESDVVRAELRCQAAWFVSRREMIEGNYRLIVVDDLYSQRPYVEIGRGAVRYELRPGSFCGSGAFMRALESIAELDRWERHHYFEHGNEFGDNDDLSEWQREKLGAFQATRPVPFPAEKP